MHPLSEKATSIGAVVQLVRMPACHAGGRGFESLPHRHKMPLSYLRGIFSIQILLPFYYLLNEEAERYKSTRPFLNSNNIALGALLLLQRYKFSESPTTAIESAQSRQFRRTRVRRNVGKRTRLPSSSRLRSRHFPPLLRAASHKISLPSLLESLSCV